MLSQGYWAGRGPPLQWRRNPGVSRPPRQSSEGDEEHIVSDGASPKPPAPPPGRPPACPRLDGLRRKSRSFLILRCHITRSSRTRVERAQTPARPVSAHSRSTAQQRHSGSGLGYWNFFSNCCLRCSTSARRSWAVSSAGFSASTRSHRRSDSSRSCRRYAPMASLL